jgi:hypothetical protein
MRRAGLVLLGLLSVADVVSAFLTDGEFPPVWVAVLGGVLGLASLAVLVPAWRGNRTALGVLIALRVVSAASALPAFGVTGVPGPVVALAGAIVVLTAVGCLLSLRRTPISP